MTISKTRSGAGAGSPVTRAEAEAFHGAQVADCRRRLEAAPQDCQAVRDLGYALAHQGHHDDAEATHPRAVALEPADAVNRAFLGLTLLWLG